MSATGKDSSHFSRMLAAQLHRLFEFIFGQLRRGGWTTKVDEAASLVTRLCTEEVEFAIDRCAKSLQQASEQNREQQVAEFRQDLRERSEVHMTNQYAPAFAAQLREIESGASHRSTMRFLSSAVVQAPARDVIDQLMQRVDALTVHALRPRTAVQYAAIWRRFIEFMQGQGGCGPAFTTVTAQAVLQRPEVVTAFVYFEVMRVKAKSVGQSRRKALAWGLHQLDPSCRHLTRSSEMSSVVSYCKTAFDTIPKKMAEIPKFLVKRIIEVLFVDFLKAGRHVPDGQLMSVLAIALTYNVGRRCDGVGQFCLSNGLTRVDVKNRGLAFWIATAKSSGRGYAGTWIFAAGSGSEYCVFFIVMYVIRRLGGRVVDGVVVGVEGYLLRSLIKVGGHSQPHRIQHVMGGPWVRINSEVYKRALIRCIRIATSDEPFVSMTGSIPQSELKGLVSMHGLRASSLSEAMRPQPGHVGSGRVKELQKVLKSWKRDATLREYLRMNARQRFHALRLLPTTL